MYNKMVLKIQSVAMYHLVSVFEQLPFNTRGTVPWSSFDFRKQLNTVNLEKFLIVG